MLWIKIIPQENKNMEANISQPGHFKTSMLLLHSNWAVSRVYWLDIYVRQCLLSYNNSFRPSESYISYICVSKLRIIASDNGLSPCRCQAIIWTNAGILLIRTLGTSFNETLTKIHTSSSKKMHVQIPSAKWRQFCLCPNVLTIANKWFYCGTGDRTGNMLFSMTDSVNN